jgi:hypothetical protein
VDSYGRAYLLFSNNSAEGYPNMVLIRRDAAGWTEPIDIFPDYLSNTGLAIVIDGDDVINVFITPWTPYDDENGFRRGYNGSWSPTYTISEGKVSIGYPGSYTFELTADCSTSGACAVVWESGQMNIWARRMLE